MRKRGKKIMVFPSPIKTPERYVLRTTITLNYQDHEDLIGTLEAAGSKAYVIRELMAKGLIAYKLELADEEKNEVKDE